MTTPDETVQPPARVRLQDLPRGLQSRIALAGRAVVLDARWLAEGLHPELDEHRQRHHELLARLRHAVDELAAAEKEWRAADAAHERALREAHRDGAPLPDDERPSKDARERVTAKHRESIKAAATVLVVDLAHEAVAWLRRHEDELLATLRSTGSQPWRRGRPRPSGW